MTVAPKAFRRTVACTAVVMLAACSSTPQPPRWQNGPEPHTVTPKWITGLQVINDGSADRNCAWATGYPSVPGAGPLTTALRKRIGTSLDTFLANREGSDRTRCRATEPGPDFNASFAFLVASADVVGVRTTVVDGTSAGSGITTATYWYDGRTRRVVPTGGLLQADRVDQTAAALRQALSDRDKAITDNLPDLPQLLRDGGIRDAGFTDTGGLTINFSRGTIAPPPLGDIAALIPRDRVDPLLSDLGRRAQQQTMHPEQQLRLGTSTGPSAPPPSAEPAPSPPRSDGPDCQQVKCVALTFDDGPGPDTRRLLGILAARQAHATFFVVGQNVAHNPQVVRDEVAAGHEIGNHTWSHRDLTTLKPAEITDQIGRADQAIEAATGFRPTLVRPPYGAFNRTVQKTVDRPLVLWRVDPRDWEHHDSAYVADHITKHVRPGDVVLMHDIHATTVDAVPQILDTLAGRGYHFVTVSQLFAPTQLTTDHTWSSNKE